MMACRGQAKARWGSWKGLLLLLMMIIISMQVSLSSMPSGSLPPNWVQYYHEGRAYYYNQVDGRRQWEYPAEDAAYAPQQQQHQPQQQQQQPYGGGGAGGGGGGGGRWYTAQDQNQRIYYVDSYTGTTTYTPPPEFAYDHQSQDAGEYGGGGVDSSVYQDQPAAGGEMGYQQGDGLGVTAGMNEGIGDDSFAAAGGGGVGEEGGGDSMMMGGGKEDVVSSNDGGGYVDINEAEGGGVQTTTPETSPEMTESSGGEKDKEELMKAKEDLEREVEELKANLEKAEKEVEEAQAKAAEESRAAEEAREEAEKKEKEAAENLESLALELDKIRENATLMLEQERANETTIVSMLKNVTAERDMLLEQVADLKSAQEADAKELEESYARFEDLESQYQQALDELQKLEDELQDEEEEEGEDSSSHQKKGRGAVAHVHGSGTSSSLLGRVVSSYVRSWIPSRLKGPTPEEREIQVLNRTIFRLRENATALMDVIESRNSLIDELHQRIEVYEEEGLRRRKTVGSLRDAISELTEEVNAKSEEIGLLRNELKEVVQELLWKEANITTLEARAVLGEARAVGLEKELVLAHADKARGLERAVNLTAQLQEAEKARELVEGEVVELRRQLEKEKAIVIAGVEELNDQINRVAMLEEERKGLQQQVREAMEATTAAVQKAEMAVRELEEERALYAQRQRDSAVVHVPHAVIPGKTRPREKGWCWFGLF